MPRGSAVLVQPGTPGADAAFPPAPSVWVPHFAWMGRYVSTPDNNPKNLDEAELDAIAAADGGIAYFVEQAEGTPVNSTLDDDIKLAKQAVKLAARWELPKACPFWYAVDTSPFGHFDTIAASFRVYRDLSDGWPVAAYIGSQCGEFLMDLGLIDYFHIPAALSWSATSAPVDNVTVFKIPGSSQRWYKSPRASLRQYPSEPFAGPRGDRNDTLLPTPMWFPGRAELDPQEDDMTDDERATLNKAAADAAQAKANTDVIIAVLTDAARHPETGFAMDAMVNLTYRGVKDVAEEIESAAGGGLTKAEAVAAVAEKLSS